MVAISRPEGAGTSSSAFFTAIHSGTAASSKEGERLTKGELRTAAKKLQSAEPQARDAAWADVLDVLADDMDPSFVKTVRESMSAGSDTVRSHNAYLAHVMGTKIAASDLTGPVVAAASAAAETTAISSAITSQISDDSARESLLAMVEGTHRMADATFLRQAWPLATSADAEGKQIIDSAKLDQVASAARAFATNDGTLVGVDSAVEALAAQLGVDAPAKAVTLNGHSPEQLAKLVNDAMVKQGTLRKIISERKIRGEEYRQLMDRIMSRPTVQALLPMVQEALAEDELTTRAEQAASGGMVLKESTLHLAIGKPYAKKIFELAQSTGKALGFTEEVAVVITPSTAPNAYVYTSDLNNPRVTFFTPMLEKFWDNRTNDWIKIHVDADGKPVDAKTPGAKELNIGELMVESVMAHELGHIRGQAIQTQAILIIMMTELGQNLLSGLPVAEQEKFQALMQQTRGLVVSHGQTGESIIPPHLEELFNRSGLLSADTSAEVIADVISSVSGEEIEAGELGLDAMEAFAESLYTLSRVEEVSADRYPIILRRTPDYTALVDAMLGLAIEGNTSDQQKIDSVRDLMLMGPEKFGTDMLAELVKELEGAKDLDALEFNNKRSHPTNAVRILQGYAFARDDDGFFGQMERYHALEPDTKLLLALQLYEQDVAEVEQEAASLVPHEGFELLRDSVQKLQLNAKVRELEAPINAMLNVVDQLVGEYDLVKADAVFVERALDFCEVGGTEMGGGTTPTRLLRHFQSQLKVLLQDTDLSAGEREIGEERLGRIEELLG